jgi:hypothetical protein
MNLVRIKLPKIVTMNEQIAYELIYASSNLRGSLEQMVKTKEADNVYNTKYDQTVIEQRHTGYIKYQ